MATINVDNKIMRAKVGIILSNPFFATLMMRKNFIADSSIETASTNGKDIKYNPEFFDSLPSDQLQGVICHELMHSVLLHHTRRNGRDLKKWNEACDYALNPVLTDSGMRLPEGALLDDRYRNLSAESIYKIIEKEEQGNDKPDPQQGDQDGQGDTGQPQQGNDPAGTGGVEDAPAETESEMAQAEAEAKQELAQAIQIAKQQGKLSAGMGRLIQEVMEPLVDWREVLARFLSEVAHNDYSFSRPNTRYIGSGFILPSLYNIEVGEIVLIADTSGSMDEELLNRVAKEMQEIASDFKSTITVLYVDTKVCGHQVIEPDDTFELNPKGGGGTDFRPGFEWISEQDMTPKCVVYLTDGYCHSFPAKEPEYPVLWGITGGYKFKPPYGEVVTID